METEQFKEKLIRTIMEIEGIMNELKNVHCLSRARYRGLENVQIQAYMAAIAINVKRLVYFFWLSIIAALMFVFRTAFYNRPVRFMRHACRLFFNR